MGSNFSRVQNVFTRLTSLVVFAKFHFFFKFTEDKDLRQAVFSKTNNTAYNSLEYFEFQRDFNEMYSQLNKTLVDFITSDALSSSRGLPDLLTYLQTPIAFNMINSTQNINILEFIKVSLIELDYAQFLVEPNIRRQLLITNLENVIDHFMGAETKFE